MTMRALVSADRPVVRIWHPDDPKVYVEIQFEMQAAANAAVEQLKYATAMSFGDERVDLFTLPGPAWRARTRSTASVCPLMTLRYRRARSVRRAEAPRGEVAARMPDGQSVSHPKGSIGFGCSAKPRAGLLPFSWKGPPKPIYVGGSCNTSYDERARA